MAEPAPESSVVVDASVLVDLLAGTDLAQAARTALGGKVMHAPAHLDVEVLSALGRLNRGRVGLSCDSPTPCTSSWPIVSVCRS